MKRILLAQPRSFCAGVERAIAILERTLASTNEPVYVRKELVHNRFVIDDLRRRGVVFVDEIDEIPAGALAVYSAHGVAPAVRCAAGERGLRVIDATCPLVRKVHRETVAFLNAGYHVVLVGHAGHEEVEGTLGHGQAISLVENEEDARSFTYGGDAPLGVVSQTTLAASDVERIIEVLRSRYPQLALPQRSDICYATENRQRAVKGLSDLCDAIIVIGSVNSSNSLSLQAVAASAGVPAFLVDDPGIVESAWLAGVRTLGITAGASSPEALVEAIVARIQSLAPEFSHIETFGRLEARMEFSLPPELRALSPLERTASKAW